ncbi:MAG: hypothetical protein AAGB22_01235 [Bacteroidota bacterium]
MAKSRIFMGMIHRWLLLVVLVPAFAWGQGTATPSKTAVLPANISDPESLVRTFYRTLSGPAGPRNWDRFRSLCLPDAQINAITYNADGTAVPVYGSVANYIAQVGPFFEQHGYQQKQLKHRVDTYGNLAQIFSTYSTRYLAPGSSTAIEEHGVASFQVIYWKNRWWIANVLWNAEAPGDPIPKRYLDERAALPAPAVAPESAAADAVDLSKVYAVDEVEIPANFPGGQPALDAYLWEQLDRSKAGSPQAVASGVTVRFIVLNDGTVSEPEVLEGSDAGWNAEVLRVMGSMPVWEPAGLGVESVRVQLEIRIKPPAP